MTSINKLKKIKINPIYIVFSIFIVSFLYRYSVANFNKILTIYPDELIYTNLAHSLANGFGLSLHHMSYPFQNCLYSLFLLPAYFIENGTMRLHLIAIINCMLMCSSIFPTFLIAKEITDDKSVWIISSLLVSTLPDLTMSMTFMSENLFYPLILWCVFVMLKSISNIGSIKWTFLSAIFAILCYFAKAIALYIPLTYVGVLFLLFCYKAISEKQFPKNTVAFIKQLIVYTLFFIVPYIAIKKLLFSTVSSSYSGAVSNTSASLINLRLLLKLIYTNFSYCNLAMLFFPIIIFLLFRGTMNEKSRILFYLTTIATLGALAVITIMISIYDSTDMFRLHMRYYSALFVPFIIMILDQTKNQKAFKGTKLLVNIIYFSGISIYLYLAVRIIKTIQYGCTADQSDMRYYNMIPKYLSDNQLNYNVEHIYKILFIGLFLLLLALILLLKSKSYMLICLIILSINFTNNAFLIKTYELEYTSEYTDSTYNDIERINNWLTSIDPESIVLIITDTYGDANSRMLDVYLNGNIYFATVDFLINNPVNDGVFTIYEGSIPATMANCNYSETHVDYIIDATNTYDFSGTTQVSNLETSNIIVFKNNDSSNIKYYIPAQ